MSDDETNSRLLNLMLRESSQTVEASVFVINGAGDRIGEAIQITRACSNQWDVLLKTFNTSQNDGRWEWAGAFGHRAQGRQKPYVDFVAIKTGDLIQGLMISGPPKETSMGPPGRQLLYLAHMATAPWNRPDCPPTSRSHAPVKGVGLELMREGIRLSTSYGFCGRIGVHTMGGVWRFARKLGLEKVQRKVKGEEFRDHPWYELSDQGVADFKKKYGL